MIVLVELFAPQMAAIFTNEAAVRDAAVLNLRIEILGQIFYAVFMGLSSKLGGKRTPEPKQA